MLFRNVALVSLALVAAASAADTNPTSDHVASLLARRRLSKEKADNKAPNLATDDGRFLQAEVVLKENGCPNDNLCPPQGWCDDKGKNKNCDKWENDAIGKGKLTYCPAPGQKCAKPESEASAPAGAAESGGAATSSILDLLDKNVLGYGDLDTLTGTIGDGENTSGTITGVQVIEPSRETGGNGAATGGTTDGAGSTGGGNNNNGAATGGTTDGAECADPKVLSLAAKGESPLGTDKICDKDCDCQDGCCVISAFGGFCTPQSADDPTRSQYGYPYLFCTSAANSATSPNQ